MGGEILNEIAIKINFINNVCNWREGISQAQEDKMQAQFDQGYKDAFKQGRSLGQLRGKIAAKVMSMKLSLINW